MRQYASTHVSDPSILRLRVGVRIVSHGSGRRLHLLDACLTQLEDAHERGERTLSPGLAARLHEHIRALAPGMLIRDAISVVLREQEPLLVVVPRAPDGSRLADPALEPLDERTAETLTERIKRTTDDVCLLLLEAHERRAPAALGYHSWEQYVRKELGISRRRSYELLDLGRVVRATRAAAGVSGIPHISAYAAEEIKPHLDEFVAAIRQQAAGRTEAERRVVVTDVIRLYRRRAAASREARRRGATPIHAQQSLAAAMTQLFQAVESLAQMPPPREVVEAVTARQTRRLQDLAAALGWLQAFACAWNDVRDLAS